MNKPGQWAVYKKTGAAQITLLPPTYNDKGRIERDGSVLIETANCTGQDANKNLAYDWENKISFSLGMNDLALLFGDIGASLVHDYKGVIKSLRLEAGVDKYEGTYKLLLLAKEQDGSSRKVMVPFSAGEMQVFSRLLDRATSKILGW